MSAHLLQYAADLHQEISTKVGDQPDAQLREDTFTETVLELLSEHNEAGGAEVFSYEGKGAARLPAAKLNAWALSGDGATLDLFVTRYYGNDDQLDEVGKPETRRHFELLLGFLKRALEGLHSKMEDSSDAFRAARQIYGARESLTTVRLFFLTDGVVRSLDLEEESVPGLEVRYVLWDLDKLSRLHVGHREVIELDFVNNYGGAIPCLQAADATGEYRTFLAYLPAPLLARIYGEHGQRLLERNVRAFLQAKGTVNRGLQRTLKEEPHRFLAYNNGLCCTAAEVRVRAGDDGHARLDWARDFQIVNGGQTTASIYHALKREKVNVDQVVVQVKLTVLSDASKVADIVPLISKYANSQNKVNAADFSANGPFHHRLEQLSRIVWAPAASGLERGTHWYYERARGSFADDRGRQDTPAKRRDWETQNPPIQKFTKTDLAKFENAWACLPHLVCSGAEKNFNRFAERMNEDAEPIVDQNYFKQVIAKAIMFRTAEKLFSAEKMVGYRANSVAYAVAWLAAQSGWRINLDRIWDEQRLSPVLREALNVTCAAAHQHITSQQGNAGEVSKRETCWHEFRDKHLAVGNEWRQELGSVAFLPITSEEQSLAREWEKIRHQFVNDPRTLEALEAASGRAWIVKRRGHQVSYYASRSWEQLRSTPNLGLKKLKSLVELFCAGAGS